jgi:hypothetical protein
VGVHVGEMVGARKVVAEAPQEELLLASRIVSQYHAMTPPILIGDTE